MAEQEIQITQAKPVRDIRGGGMVAPIIPQSVAEVAMIASAVIKAGLAPDSYQEKTGSELDRAERTKSKIMIGILKGAEVGLPPITALSTIAIINGRPTIWGDGAVALVQNSGQLERMEEAWEGEETTSGPATMDNGEKDYAPRISDFPDAYTAVVKLWRKGQSIPYEGRFSVRDAKRAHLWGNTKKTPWIEYPKRMLKARARAFALRDGFSDALHGLSIREEIEDLPGAAPERTDTAFLDDTPATAGAIEHKPQESAQDNASPEKLAAFDFIRNASDLKSLMAWYTSEAPDELADDPEVIAAYEAKRNELAA